LGIRNFMVTKRNLLLVVFLLDVILFTSNYVGTYWICDHLFFGGHEGSCPGILANGIIVFYPFFPLLILSLITYKMRDEVFRTWLKFTYVWIPLTMFLILIAPEYGNAFLPIEKGTVAGFFSLLYILISLLLITYKYFATRNSK